MPEKIDALTLYDTITREKMFKLFHGAQLLEIGGPTIYHTGHWVDTFAASSLTFINPRPSKDYECVSLSERYHPSVKMIKQKMQEAKIPANQFDIITSILVFGSMGNNNEFGLNLRSAKDRQIVLEQLRTWLRPGGILIVDVIPDIKKNRPDMSDTGISNEEWKRAGFNHCPQFDQGYTFYFALKK